MTWKRAILSIVLLLFLALTARAVTDHGYDARKRGTATCWVSRPRPGA